MALVFPIAARLARSTESIDVARHRLHDARRRLERSIEKNRPDAKALLTGRLPAFVTRRHAEPLAEVPVFVFHDVEPDRFEAQLRYLHDNGYVTLGADGLEAALRGERPTDRVVALTFDDATSTFWSYALPLLRRYDARAILFAIPGLVTDDVTTYPNLSDAWSGNASFASIERRRSIQPLCTWKELRLVHGSGLVDIESHGLSHARVAVSPRIIDFVHPGLDTSVVNHPDVPFSPLDPRERACGDRPLGAPIFESAPQLSGRSRFLPAPELVTALMDYVDTRGGEHFFTRSSWRRELGAIAKKWRGPERGRFETAAESQAAMAREMLEAGRQLEQRLDGKQVRHFCYPWFTGCRAADRLATQMRYSCVHYGIDMRGDRYPTHGLERVRRVSEWYLQCLPGHGRVPLRSAVGGMIRRRMKRKNGSNARSGRSGSPHKRWHAKAS